jgi:hypothetical protein
MCRLMTAAVLLVLTMTPARAQDDMRAFTLGFTPFPYEISFEAVLDTYETLAQNADLISHHFDNGVPWVEALAESEYSQHIRDDWNLRLTQTRPDDLVLVAVTPIRFDRGGLATYRGTADDMPLPPPWDSYGFDHPDVIEAFYNYCEDIIAYFEPDYFNMGIEVNLLMKIAPARWNAYLTLHREVYARLKEAYPDLPIFVSVTGIDLLPGYTDADADAQARALTDILPYTDVLALSMYPYMTRYMTNEIPQDMFDRLAGLTDLPLAVTETGYPAQSFAISGEDGTRLEFNGTPEKQAAYIDLLLNEAQEHQMRFVINFVLRDYDALWQQLGGREDLTIAWRDTGLIGEDGAERPALAIWREWLTRDLDPAG